MVYQPEESVRQYTRNSVFMGEDGVVYFSLDSGYLIAIKGKQPVAEEPTPEPQPEPTPEPDQGSDNGGDVEEHTLKAETKENGLDLQATLKAKPAEDLILTVERKDAKALASDQYSFTEVFDINLITTEGKKVQPGSTLTISLRPSTDIEENTVLIHEIIENGERRLERLNYTVTEDEKGKLITFEVNHLSLFGLGKVVDKSSDGNVTPETSKPAETSKPEGTNKPDSKANVGKTGAQSSVITATALIALAIAIYKLRNKDEEQDLI